MLFTPLHFIHRCVRPSRSSTCAIILPQISGGSLGRVGLDGVDIFVGVGIGIVDILRVIGMGNDRLKVEGKMRLCEIFLLCVRLRKESSGCTRGDHIPQAITFDAEMRKGLT